MTAILKRSYYAASIAEFLSAGADSIFGLLAKAHNFDLTETQKAAWDYEISSLKELLVPYKGAVLLEYSIPRMGRRIDAVVLIEPVVFVLEYKVGEELALSGDLDQVTDYALDLKNFHEGSHHAIVAPILVATDLPQSAATKPRASKDDGLLAPIATNPKELPSVIEAVLSFAAGKTLSIPTWRDAGYKPTPTIVEAALALYSGHSVQEISRNDAGATNLSETSAAVSEIIASMQKTKQKAICFVTGVPGAGKTLVGLNVATTHSKPTDELYSVFLSGNGPLVAVLQEALARDQVARGRKKGTKVRKGEATSRAKAFIQNVHHFRDECLADPNKVPAEHVAIFDEAQRAWNLAMTADFMKRKKGIPGFLQSEPEYLISCMDRHKDWAVIVCLVGGGQEINRGEAGIQEWVTALGKSFPHWKVFVSDNLRDSEYGAGEVLEQLEARKALNPRPQLHLSTSIRSFRTEKVSQFVKELLDLNLDQARRSLSAIQKKYPIVLTKDPERARRWLREQARGTERCGLVVSSQAVRLKPHAIDVKSPMNPVHWFLGEKDDVRSSYYLEDVATEFHVQGLELDWAGVIWDADFRYAGDTWQHWSFKANRWERIRKQERQTYLKNAYRVLLTRARQGMVIAVPEGAPHDPTRSPDYYRETFSLLEGIGLEVIC